MSTCDGDSDSDSSEKGTPEILSQSDSTVTIPTSEVDRITFAPFQTYRCYGVDIEFPVNRTPFPSQRSVMTLVLKSIRDYLYRSSNPCLKTKMQFLNLQLELERHSLCYVRRLLGSKGSKRRKQD